MGNTCDRCIGDEDRATVMLLRLDDIDDCEQRLVLIRKLLSLNDIGEQTRTAGQLALITCLFELHRYQETAEEAQKLIDAAVMSNATISAMCGISWVRAGQPLRAVGPLTAALRYYTPRPNCAKARASCLANRSLALSAIERPQSALEDALLAVRVDGEPAHVRYALARALFLNGQYAAAVGQCRRGLRCTHAEGYAADFAKIVADASDHLPTAPPSPAASRV